MKVLMLGWELPPHNSGGLGVACYQLCKALSKTGVDIEFVLPYSADHGIDFMKVTPAIPQDVQAVMKSGIAYDSFKFLHTDGREEWVSLNDQYELFAVGVENLVGLGQYDIIHAHDWLTFRAALRAKQITGLPLIVHIHATEYDRSGGNKGNAFVREVEYTGMMLADKIIAVSQATKDVIVREYGIPAEKIDVVHNKLDPAFYEPIVEANAYRYLEHMKSQGYRVVVNIGRLTIQKGLVHLLEAAREVIFRAPKTLFMIIGSGEQYYELIDKAADLGIAKNVIFVDFQRGKNIRDAYKVADLFVLPSKSEPFGLTALEAIGFDTPVLLSNQSGVSEVLKNALKVDFWDVNEMANQITAVVQHDPLRDELATHSRQELDRLTWDEAASKISGMYHAHRSGAAA